MQSPNDTLALWGSVGALVMQSPSKRRPTVGTLVMQHVEPQQDTANSWCAGNAACRAPAKDGQPMCLRSTSTRKQTPSSKIYHSLCSERSKCCQDKKNCHKKCENCLYPLKSAVIPPKKCKNCMYPLKSRSNVLRRRQVLDTKCFKKTF